MKEKAEACANTCKKLEKRGRKVASACPPVTTPDEVVNEIEIFYSTHSSRLIEEGKITFKEKKIRLLHDCRPRRASGVYEAPGEILLAIPVWNCRNGRKSASAAAEEAILRWCARTSQQRWLRLRSRRSRPVERRW
jgi:hypothetical protein